MVDVRGSPDVMYGLVYGQPDLVFLVSSQSVALVLKSFIVVIGAPDMLIKA